jgi:hypothetical protein
MDRPRKGRGSNLSVVSGRYFASVFVFSSADQRGQEATFPVMYLLAACGQRSSKFSETPMKLDNYILLREASTDWIG